MASSSSSPSPQPVNVLSALRFEMEQIAGFRYRAESVLAKLRPAIVREARIEGLRKELINSQKLQAHFAAKPSDLVALQHVHQAPLVAGQVDRGLRQVPGYMVPKSMLKNPNGVIGQARKALGGASGGGGGRGGGRGGKRGGRGGRGSKGRGRGRSKDPLKNFGKKR
jgi:ATP-dependent RNA helicase DDX56/DBP9